MTTINIKMAAFSGAGEEIFKEGRQKLSELIPKEKISWVDANADLLFFLTGGSERSALEGINPNRFQIILASSDGNSNAAALEVKAALKHKKIPSVLLDFDAPDTKPFLERLHQTKKGLSNLKGQKLGLIGEVSEWLVASAVKTEILDSVFGIQLHQIPWSSIPSFKEMSAPKEFLSQYHMGDPQEVEKAGQVYSLLKSTLEKEQLDAMTVECFSLVRDNAVSGCLALAMLNNQSIPAACEGDIASAAGMMLSRELTGTVPWMANIAKIGYEKTLLAHCTISPNLVSNFSIRTHFETGVGTAIEGDFMEDTITAFRIDETASRMFITKGEILNRPTYSNACRTQIEVRFPESSVDTLREDPLGNHHLILPGDHEEILKLACQILNIAIIQ